jgi:hypothetical protein
MSRPGAVARQHRRLPVWLVIWLDWAIVAAYLVFSLGLGLYLGRRALVGRLFCGGAIAALVADRHQLPRPGMEG